jgi:predicted RecB family endonuclease
MKTYNTRKRSKKKRSRQTEQYMTGLIMLMSTFMTFLIIVIFRIITLLFDVITYYSSSYRSKSDNGLIKTLLSKGEYGEFVLYRKIISVFGKQFVMTNLYVENKTTEQTEIDVLAVSKRGIYVFEMKNYGGYIYGSGNDRSWTQVMNPRSKKSFYNPLRQNATHAKGIAAHLGVSMERIIPVVVFSNRAKLRKIKIDSHDNVLLLSKVKRYMRKSEKKGALLISDEERKAYTLRLLEACHMPKDVKQKHIDNVQQLIDRSPMKKKA